MLDPGTPQEMLFWLAKLRHSVRNAPDGWRDILAKGEGIWEDCQDLPRGVWCEATRKAWRQQPRRGDYLPGSFWPLPGELYAILREYADQLQRDARGCRQVIAAE